MTLAASLGALPAPAAAGGACPASLYTRAEGALPEARTRWGSLAKHWGRFAACDDGALAEGYSDAVVTLFARRWGEFPTFARLAKGGPSFARWAVGHVDETAADDDLRRIRTHTARCRGNNRTRALCTRIGKAAVSALSESPK